MAADEPKVFRPGGISYLRIPARNPQRLAGFYRAVFGWPMRDDRPDPAFEDGSGHVIGHIVSDLAVAGDAGIRPYVYVHDLDATLATAVADGAEVVTEPYPEEDLWVAAIRDPDGNVVGVWQRGPRG